MSTATAQSPAPPPQHDLNALNQHGQAGQPSPHQQQQQQQQSEEQQQPGQQQQPPPQEGSDHQQQQEQQQQQQQHGEHPSANPSGIERDVGTILAGLNQEQLASIVAAARASEASGQGHTAQDPSAYNPNSGYDSSNPLANLPPGLGQAASALTSFASSFKRSTSASVSSERDRSLAGEAHNGSPSGVGASSSPFASSHTRGHPGLQPPPAYPYDPPPASMPGQNSLARPDVKPDAPPPPGTEHQADSQELANNAHDTAATAAAIAAMGSLAGHHLQDQGHSAGSPGHDPNQMPAGLPMTDGQDGGSPSGRGHPKKKGPEMDRQRKDNHKEVERRRREAINDGITELSKIVPGCDAKNTNKGSIITAAVRYIQDLKNNEASNIEKWTLEKLLMDQAMNDLQVQLDDARRENERFRLMLGSEATKPAGAEGAAQPQAPPPAPGAEGSKHEGSNGYREQGYDQQGRPYAEGSYNGQHRNSPYHHSADYTHESHAYDSQTGRPIEQPVVDPSLERERPEGVAQPVDPAVGAGGEKRGREEPETPVGPGAQAQGQAQIAEGENEADREAKRARIA